MFCKCKCYTKKEWDEYMYVKTKTLVQEEIALRSKGIYKDINNWIDQITITANQSRDTYNLVGTQQEIIRLLLEYLNLQYEPTTTQHVPARLSVIKSE